MRIVPFPWQGERLPAVIIASLTGAFIAFLLVWATNTLDKDWLFALAGGMVLLWAAVLSGRFERFLLGLILFVIPFNADIQFRPFFIPVAAKPLEVSAVHLLLVILYPLWMIRVVSEKRSVPNFWPAGIGWLAILIGWGTLSTVNARSPQLSFIMFVGLLQGFLTFFYLASHIRTREDLWFASRCLLAGLAVECLLTLAQYATGKTLGLEFLGERVELYTSIMGSEKVSRVVGTSGHSNALGAYLVTVLPLAMALSLTNLPTRTRWVTAGLFFFGLFTLVITLNRSGWLSMTFISFLFLCWLLIYERKNFKPLLLISMALIGGLILASFAPLILSRWIEPDAGAAASRLTLMKVAFSMIKSHPLLGVGLNNYTLVMHLYDQTSEGIAFRYPRPVHNAYFLLAAETGLVGLFAYLFFLQRVFRNAWGRVKTGTDELTRFILVALMLGLIGRLLDGFLQPRYLSSDLFIWIYPALLAVRHGEDGS